jgi:hypothetical protein
MTTLARHAGRTRGLAGREARGTGTIATARSYLSGSEAPPAVPTLATPRRISRIDNDPRLTSAFRAAGVVSWSAATWAASQ